MTPAPRPPSPPVRIDRAETEAVVTEPNVRSVHLGPLYACRYGKTDGWFRLFGYGLSIERPAHPDGWVSFSERNGYRKAWHVGGACIKVLTRRGRSSHG